MSSQSSSLSKKDVTDFLVKYIGQLGKKVGKVTGLIKYPNVLLVKIVNERTAVYYKTWKPSNANDSGFDLVSSADYTIPPTFPTDSKVDRKETDNYFEIDLGIQCQYLPADDGVHGYFLFPRSSFSKTPLLLANGTGIFDFDYRGNARARVRNLSQNDFKVTALDKLFQFCSHDLSPLHVKIVTELTDTKRGAGGFGSTDSKKTDITTDDQDLRCWYHDHPLITKENLIGLVTIIILMIIFCKILF